MPLLDWIPGFSLQKKVVASEDMDCFADFSRKTCRWYEEEEEEEEEEEQQQQPKLIEKP